MNTFHTARLANHRVLVTGTDGLGNPQQTVLPSYEYDQLIERDKHAAAAAKFDDAVENFFAPLTAAADAVANAVKPEMDPDLYLVINEAREGVAGQTAHIIELLHSTAVLRLIDAGKTGRLIWIDNTIEILEHVATTKSDELAAGHWDALMKTDAPAFTADPNEATPADETPVYTEVNDSAVVDPTAL